MTRWIIAIFITVTIAASSTEYAVSAPWPTTDLYAYGSTETVAVTPTFTMDGDYYIYQYVLTNNTVKANIGTFYLTFDPIIDVNKLTVVSSPLGWRSTIRTKFNQIAWVNITGSTIAPTDSAIFSFKTLYSPLMTTSVIAACYGGLGWSGDTYGPVPEPSSIIALMCGVVGLFGYKLKRK